MENKYSEYIAVKFSETEYNHSLKPYALLNYLQDIADKNAEDLGFGVSYLSKKDYAWFLIKYHMEFNDYPIDKKDLLLITEPRGYKKLFSYRDFSLKSEYKVIGNIVSEWAIIDTNKHSLVNIGAALEDNPNMPPYTLRENDLSFDKIPKFSEFEKTKDFMVRYNDLDKNGHANNGNYIIWAFETIDLEFKSTHKIKTLDIIFKKEAKYNEKVISQMNFAENTTTLHKISNESGEDLCLIKCVWETI